ncbi:hypothetical protein DFH07DRAFT_730734 [Mycena maculata]|uniref:MYND-type domain-containing protein n=1 Tax=Mycena maculata TaxID=230809 RepID=A0AAD7NX41_9AGAR|nr:hypothetical protein DFH07DRAFT_730734 [Mycena maculata]
MASSATQTCCVVCKTSTVKKCARCGITYYCSVQYDLQHWKTHKSVCLAPAVPLATIVKTRAEAERDGDTKFVIDAILLPFDSDEPRFVKIACEMYADEDSETFLGAGFMQHCADLDPYMGPHHNTLYKSIPILTFGYTGPPLGHTLSLMWRDTFMVDGSPVNRSIIKLTKGKAYHPWAGNLLAYRVDEPTSLVARCKDAKVEDLAVLAAYFVDYGKRAKQLGR